MTINNSSNFRKPVSNYSPVGANIKPTVGETYGQRRDSASITGATQSIAVRPSREFLDSTTEASERFAPNARYQKGKHVPMLKKIEKVGQKDPRKITITDEMRLAFLKTVAEGVATKSVAKPAENNPPKSLQASSQKIAVRKTAA